MKNFFSKVFNKFKSLILHYGWLTLIIIPILALVNLSYFSVITSEKESLKTQQIALANEKVNMIDFIISNAISNTHNDMRVMLGADELNEYLNDESQLNMDKVEQLIYRITNNKPEFSSVEFLDLSGNQIIFLKRQNDNLMIVDETELVNKSEEDYYPVISNLSVNQFYIFPIHIIEIITDSGTINKPMTSFGSAVFDTQNNKKGYLIINYDANHLLSLFNQYVSTETQFTELGIINQDQYWGITSGFYDLIQYDDELIDLYPENDDSIISSIVNINPSIKENIYNEEDFLQIFALINFEAVFKEYGNLFVRFPIFIYILNLFTIIGTYLLASTLKNRSDNRILLNANMYLSDKNNDGVLITNEYGEITYANQAFEDLYSFKLDQIKGKNPSKILGGLNYSLKGTGLKSNEVFAKNVWNVNNKGIHILKHLRVKPETNANGNVKHFMGIYSSPQIDIESLAFSSNFDAIESYKLFARAFEDDDLTVKKSCAMVIRTYNEKSKKMFGSRTKTNLSPLAFSAFLNLNLGSSFKIAVPADNYVLIFVSLAEIDDSLSETIDRIDNLIEKYKHQPNINSTLEYNFGIALADNKTITKAELIENAFIALQMSKTQKNIKHLIYTEEIKQVIKREKDIYAQLEHGFNFDEFFLQYQIQKDIKRNSYTGVEALLRWNNSFLGNISPVHFISIIENSFFINRLSLMVMTKVIKDFTPYIEYINPNFRISINLTYFDFFNENIIHNLVGMIEKSPLSTKNFCFEITESGYLENKEKTNNIIKYLHSKNIIVAIDDFGTGFSSLEVLKNIHVDKVKIDRSFIKDYPEKDNGIMFKTIVSLVQSMNLGILVEGTETKEQVDFALECGCDEIQGYFISQPIYIENLVRKFLNKKSDF